VTKPINDQPIILEIISNYGSRHTYKKIKYKHPELYQRILDYANALPRNITWTEKLFMYYYNITTRPGCIVCGETVKAFYSFNRGHSIYCSRKCVARDNLTKQRRQQTIKARYGVDSLVEIRWHR